jgi:two-component sensor histidine kinase
MEPLFNYFSTNGFMPHGHCYLWNPALVTLHVISDALIFLAYVTIPITLIYLARKRRDIPFNWMLFCFGIFIVSCGTTHLMEIWTLWNPDYWLSGMIKAITAVSSVATAILLVRLVPVAVAMPTQAMMEEAKVEIIESKLKEEQSEAALNEKDILLAEIHHRVKNNLQIVQSLLNLQASKTDDNATSKLLQDTQNRIHAMALIHQTLYQTNDFSKVDFKLILNSLVASLVESYSIDTSKIQFSVTAAPIALSLNQAIPCSLVVNELITNALKYAFPDNHSGEISVELSSQENQTMLTISDNGQGIPENVDLQSSSSLGLNLVHMLAIQLDSVLTVRRANPTSFTLLFPTAV